MLVQMLLAVALVQVSGTNARIGRVRRPTGARGPRKPTHRERFEAPFTMDELKEDLRRKFDEAAYAGVKYWKVDWGVHNFHVWYRRLMSEMKERYYLFFINVQMCKCESGQLSVVSTSANAIESSGDTDTGNWV